MASIYRDNLTAERETDRTDRIMTVHTPVHWLLLGGLLIVFLAFLLWACFGTLSKSVSASGLYHPGGSEYGEIIALMPLTTGKTVDVGMDVTVYLSGYNMQEYGHMKGTITYTDKYTTSVEDMRALLEDEILVSTYVQNGACVAVICKLQEDESSENGFYWSNERGSKLKIHDGTWAALTIVEETTHPIELGIPQVMDLFK